MGGVLGCDREEAPPSAPPPGDRPNLYPGMDPTIWTRTCTHEQLEPLDGTVTGAVPAWLRGALVRNGPGRMEVNGDPYGHLFDGSALLHRFSFQSGRVTYQNRYVRSQSFLRDTEAGRVVTRYFGTDARPDPCRSIMRNLSSKFILSEQMTDNCQISVYPYGDGTLYALTETPYIHRVDPSNLDTKERVDLFKEAGLLNHTSHPHVRQEGVFNVGQALSLKRQYNIYLFPTAPSQGKVPNPFKDVKVLASVPCRWMTKPCYMHSFSMTKNYFVIIEQPMGVSLPKMTKGVLFNERLMSALEWTDEQTLIHLVHRSTGQRTPVTYITDSFFYLHTINAFESDGHVVLDVAAYKDAKMLDCMYVESLKNASYDPSFAQMFRGRPKRWVLPINPSAKKAKKSNFFTRKKKSEKSSHESSKSSYNKPTTYLNNSTQDIREADSFSLPKNTNNVIGTNKEGVYDKLSSNTDSDNYPSPNQIRKHSQSADALDSISEKYKYLDDESNTIHMIPTSPPQDETLTSNVSKDSVKNLTSLMNTKSWSYWHDKNVVFVVPELLVDIGCEVPTINYERFSGKSYRFFYAICSDVDRPRPGTLVKVDVEDKTFREWSDDNVYPSEPVFVPAPGAQAEDDGVLLSSVVRAEDRSHELFLLVLDARSFEELARVTFTTRCPTPKCLHGWFVSDARPWEDAGGGKEHDGCQQNKKPDK